MDPPNEHTRVVAPDAAGIAEAARLILSGQCVAVPTETVYGLAADATRADAAARIYEAKGRPGFNPLIVHVSSLEDAEAFAIFDDCARGVASRFWPGPLTLVLPARPGSPIAPAVTAGLATIALRVPAHPAVRALLARAGKPLAAPSANRSGAISPTAAAHVLHTLAGRIPLILDGGATPGGLESTIVAIGETVRLLRPGPISADALPIDEADPSGAIEAPGQLASHYKPGKPLSLNCMKMHADAWFIGFGDVAGSATLGATGDLTEAAATLYARLHEADASDRPRIHVAPVPNTGIGAAINDRLRRAAV